MGRRARALARGVRRPAGRLDPRRTSRCCRPTGVAARLDARGGGAPRSPLRRRSRPSTCTCAAPARSARSRPWCSWRWPAASPAASGSRRAVRRGVLARDLEFPYHPHVTVAHDLPDAGARRGLRGARWLRRPLRRRPSSRSTCTATTAAGTCAGRSRSPADRVALRRGESPTTVTADGDRGGRVGQCLGGRGRVGPGLSRGRADGSARTWPACGGAGAGPGGPVVGEAAGATVGTGAVSSATASVGRPRDGPGRAGGRRRVPTGEHRGGRRRAAGPGRRQDPAYADRVRPPAPRSRRPRAAAPSSHDPAGHAGTPPCRRTTRWWRRPPCRVQARAPRGRSAPRRHRPAGGRPACPPGRPWRGWRSPTSAASPRPPRSARGSAARSRPACGRRAARRPRTCGAPSVV